MEQFIIKLQAMLDKVKSIANIKSDIKSMESKLKVKIQGTLDKTSVKKELNAGLKNIKPKIKVDADTSQAIKKMRKLGQQKTTTKIQPTVDNSQVMSSLKATQKETKSLFDRFLNGVVGVNLVRMSVQKVTQAIYQAITGLKELDTIKTNIQMVSGTSDAGVDSMMSSYNAMAKELSSTTKSVSEAANEFLRMGESVASTNELIKSSQVLSKVGMIESSEAASYLISSLKGYKIEAEDSINIIDKLTSVDLEAAVSAGGLAEAMSRCANIANSSGTSMDRLIGYMATAGEVTQDSMSVIGNSFKSMYSRMNNIKIGRFIDDETGESLSDTEAVLEKLGIKLRDTEDTYRSFDDVLDDVGTRWKDFTKVEQNAISVAIAGTMQRERFTALMNNYSSALKYSETAANSAGSALQRYGVYQDSIEAKTNELTASIESLSTNTISEDLFSGIIGATTNIVEFIDKMGILKGTLAGVVAMGISKMFVSIATGIVSAAKSTAQLTTAMALLRNSRNADDLKNVGKACKGLNDNQLKLVLSTKGLGEAQRLQILTGMGVAEAEREQMLATLGFASAENAATASTFSFKGALDALKVAFLSNPIGAIITSLTVAVSGITMFSSVIKQKNEELIQSTKDTAQTYSEFSKNISDSISKYQELQKALNDAKGNEEETYDIKKQLLDLQTELNEKYGEEHGKINLVTDAYKDQTEALRAYNEEAAKGFLNENRKGIDYAEKEMTRDRTYSLGSLSGLSNVTEDERKLLKEIKKIAEENGIRDTYDGFKFIGNAGDASESINNFMNEIKLLGDESGNISEQMSGMFDKILDRSGEALTNAKDVINEYGEIYTQAKMANIAGDKNLSRGYEEAIKAVEAYNEAILKSENPYNDENVNKAWNNLQAVKQGIQAKEDVWGQYSDIMENVFSAAGDNVYSFYQVLQSDKTISELAEELRGLSDIDLQAMNNDGDNGDAFDQLCTGAKEYGLEVEDIIDLLIELGYIQNKIAEQEDSVEDSLSDRFQSLWDSESFSDAKSDLAKLSKEAGITADDIRSLASENEELASLLTESGISAQFAATCFNRVCDGADGFSAITEDALALDQALHGMDESLEAVSAAKSRYDKAMSGDDYNTEFKNYQEAYKSAMEMFENGDYGKHFRSAMEYLLGDDSYTMSIDEMYESVKNLKSIFGEKGTNGLEFLDMLYSKKEVLDGLGSSLEKLSDGTYNYDLNPEDFEAIGDAVGMTADEVASCVNALGMFGDHSSYDLGELKDALDGMSVSAKNSKESFLSIQGIESMLSDLGYAGYDIYHIMQDIQGMDGIKLIDFQAGDEAALKETVAQLKELDMIEFDGKNINVDALISSLRDSFHMASDDIGAFVGNLGNSYTFSDKDGNTVSKNDAVAKAQQSDIAQTKDTVDSLDSSVKTAQDDISELNAQTLQNLRNEFNILGGSVETVLGKINMLNADIRNLDSNLASISFGTGFTGIPSSAGKTGGFAKPGQKNGGTAKASGTGDIGVQKNETALINELGNETIIDPEKGTYEIVKGGAQFRKLKKGQIVLNHLQTEALKKNGKISTFGKMLFRGNAGLEGSSYAFGSVSSKNTAGNKNWGGSGRKSSSSGSSSNSSGADKSSIEVFDFIEIAISRIEEAIARLKEKAEAAFHSFSYRGKQYKKAITKTTKEIDLQSKAYSAYMAKANSVGLDESWAAQVRNGSINIADIADENLRNQINDYKEWYEKAHACKEKLEELKNAQRELTQERIEVFITRYEKLLENLEAKNSKLQDKINLKETWGGSGGTGEYRKMNRNIQVQILETIKQNRKLMELQKTVKKGSEAWHEYNERINTNNASIRTLTQTMGENAVASASIFKQKAEKKNEEKDTADEKLDTMISNAFAVSGKNGLLNSKIGNLDDRQKNLQSAYNSTRKKREKSGNKILNMSSKNVSKKNKKLFKTAIAKVKSGELIPASTISGVTDAMQSAKGKEYRALSNLLFYCNYYNAYKNAEEENALNLEMYSLTVQAEKRAFREEQLDNDLERYQKKADRATLSTAETAGAKNHNADIQARLASDQAEAQTNARKKAEQDRKTAGDKISFSKEKKYKNLKDKKLKKRLQKAVSSIKSGKAIDKDSMNAVKEFCQKYLNNDLTYYYNCEAYNEAVENALSAEEAETLAKAEAYAASLQTKREKAENTAAGRESQNEFYSAAAKNQTSAASKNAFLDKQIANNKKNADTYQTAYHTAVSDFNATKGTISKSSSKDKAKQKIISEIKSKYTSKNIRVPASYIEKAYTVSQEFGLACENYNEALEAKDIAKEAADLHAQTVKTENAALALEKLSNIEKEYDNKQHTYDQRAEKLNHSIDLVQAKGYQVGTKHYEKLIQNESSINTALAKKRQELIKSLEDSVKNGTITKYSDEWYEAVSQIDDVTNALDDSTLSLEEFKKQMRQIKWDNFDYIEGRISSLISETNFLIGELERKDMASDKTGSLTEHGHGAAYLHASNYELYKRQASDYQKEIAKINQELAKDPYNKELLDHRDSLVKSYQDVIKGAQDEKYAVIDLYKQGYEALSNKIQELISDYEKLLDAQKDAYEYQNTIADKTKEISNIRKQMDAYAGDLSEETRAKLQSLTVSLEQAEKDLQDTQYDKYISDTKDMLSDLQDDFAEAVQQVIDSLADHFDILIDDIEDTSTKACKAITESMTGIGYTSTEEFCTLLNSSDLSSSAARTADGIANLCTKMEQYADAIADALDITTSGEEVDKNTSSNNNNKTSDSNTGSQSSSIPADHKFPTGEKVTTEGILVSTSKNQEIMLPGSHKFPTGKLSVETVPVSMSEKQKSDALKYLNDHLKSTKAKRSELSDLNKKLYDNFGKKILTTAQMKELAKKLDVKYDNQKSSGKLYKKLKSIGVKGFKIGSHSIPYDQWAFLGEGKEELQFDKKEGVLRQVGKGDMVFTGDMTENLWKLSQADADLIMKSLQNPATLYGKPVGVQQPVKNEVKQSDYTNVSIQELNLPNVTNYEEFRNGLIKDKLFEKAVNSLTVEKLGKNYHSINKNKYIGRT